MTLLLMLLFMSDYPKIEGPGNLLVKGEQYLRALEHENSKLLKDVIHDEIHFHEPSSTCLAGTPLEAKGKANFLSFWQAAFDATHRLDYDIRHSFETGQWAVYFLIASFEADRAAVDGKAGMLRGTGEQMVMLRFKDGKVIEHLGFPNCDTLIRQMQAKINK